ncbi:MAG: phage integrase SAM-like domain-containing protein, partial [Akkermansia sp.]
MAGIIKRNNIWVAVIKVGCKKEARISTKVSIVPGVLKLGETLKSAQNRSEMEARVVAAELEKMYQGYSPDIRLVETIIGYQAAHAMLSFDDASTQTTSAYLQNWLKSREHKIGAKERDGKAIRQFLDWLGKRQNVNLSKINMGMSREFMEHELERVSSGTVKRYLATLTCAFNRAVEKQFIPSNPFRGVVPSKRERADKQERSAFSIEEVRRMVEVFLDEWPDMIRVCLYTGGQRLGDIAK